MDAEALERQVVAAMEVGMAPAVWARAQPHKAAVIELSGKIRTFRELNANANRIARHLRAAGLGPGDAAALVCSNRLEFADVLMATMRIGVRLTPVNWHLTPEEIAYVVGDCEARAVLLDVEVPGSTEIAALCGGLEAKVSIGGDLPGFTSYAEVLRTEDPSDIEHPSRGGTMLYTSGTTGRPKGVHRPHVIPPGYDPGYDRERDLHICTGPGYHASPMAGDIRRPLINGVPTLLVDRWDSEAVLRAIAERGVTRGHFVPIMFQRLLALPQSVRDRYDLTTMKRISHGAAPCPPEVKRAMIDWLGPIIHEYYAGSEGGVGFWVTADEWLKKPGTVGKLPSLGAAFVLDEAGEPCPPGVAGKIYMRLADQGGFQYFKDPTKTLASQKDGYFTMGDVGYFDEDGYLFLTGRDAETIIAGGVNIYPQEIDNELIKHPAIADSCTIGAPHPEWGEEVRAVVQLKPGVVGDSALRQDILDFAAAHIAKFKVPRDVIFAASLPRSEAGKIQRNKVRAPFWEGREKQI